MNWNRLRLRLWSDLFGRKQLNQELDAEIRAHIALETQRRIDTGESPEAARAAAMRQIRSVDVVKEATRDSWTWGALERLEQDLRYALRMMRKRPGFTLTAILSLTLGIGANTAVFSILNALLLEPLPVHRPEELVRLVEENRETSSVRDVFTYTTYDQLRANSRTLSEVIVMSKMYLNGSVIIERGLETPAFVQLVSDNYFDAFGVQPFRGRLLQSGEPGAVISHAFWRAHFGEDLAALGATFRYYRRDFTIVGIAPPEFHGTDIDLPTEIWVPIEQALPADSQLRTRSYWLHIIGRLRPGETIASANTEATAILSHAVQLESGATGYSSLRTRLSRPLFLLELLVVVVMLLTCANLANLVLADISARESELAIRLAVGASRGRIVRQLFTESFLFAILSGTLAMMVANWMSSSLLTFLPPEQTPSLVNLQFRPGLRVLAFATLLSFTASTLFGLFPILRAMRAQSAPKLKSHDRRWMSRGLLVSEMAMCTLLIIVAGLFARTVQNLRWQNTGYQEDRLLVADIGFPGTYSEDKRDQLLEELQQRAASLPGVEVASFSHAGQLSGSGIEYKIHLPGTVPPANDETYVIFEQRVTPGFLAAMGTRLLAGRDFTLADDVQAAPVAIVNEAFVRKYRLNTNPIGQRFIKEGGSRRIQTIEIVGLVADAKWIDLRRESPAMYYIPYRQNAGTPVVRFAIRAQGDLDHLGAQFAGLARSIDPQMKLKNVVPFGEIVDRSLMLERLVAQVSTAFGALATLIAAIGLYGVLAYSVIRRRREIGVRIAVGAAPRSVEWMVLRESLGLLLVGFVIGVPAALLVTRLVSSMLFGLSPQDPSTIVAAIGVLAITTVAAAYIPARRASRVDPNLALRVE